MYVKGKENNYKMSRSLVFRDPNTLQAFIYDVDKTLEEVLEDFNGIDNVAVTSDAGKTIDIFEGFTKVSSVSLEKDTAIGDVVTVILQKPDRIDALEEAVDMLTMAILSEEGE